MTTNAHIPRRKQKTILATDLWCGGGGTSSGLVKAVQELGYNLELTAVNHWEIAVATHSKNHPKARHFCKAVDSINPLDLYADRRLQLLVASPECVHHSRARGGKPRDEQKRADAWDLQRWIEKLYIENLLIENVREFVDWGPLGADGKPLKSKKGVYFKQFIDYLKILYKVEWRVLNCADYGDATTRERFFLIAKRGKNKKIVFPAKTHASRKEIAKAKRQPHFFDNSTADLKPWVPAREIIDWGLPGKSIFGRKKPLSENTMKRIFAGLFKYSLKPFVLPNEGFHRGNQPRDIDEPIPTVTSRGGGNVVEPFLVNLKATNRRDRSIDEPCFTQCSANHQMLVNPFLVKYHGNENGAHSVDEPLSTITTKDRLALLQPYLVQYFGGMTAVSVENPLPTVCANYEHYALAEPYLISYHGGQKDGGVNRSHKVDEPVPTLDTSNRFGVCEPYLIQFYGENNGQKPRTREVDEPLWTVTPQIRMGVCEPFIVPCNHGKGDVRAHSVDEPMKTITGIDAWGMVEPFLVRFKNNQDGQSIDDPLKTLTTKESYGLCIPQLGAILDIRFRMLQPSELAAAMSFPKDYYFHGTRDQQVKQIGNAVPCETAKALCKAILES